MSPEQYYALRDHIYSDFSYMHVNDLGCMDFAGGYPGNLHEEINNFSIIAGVVARQQEFDIIHAHDWLTYPAGYPSYNGYIPAGNGGTFPEPYTKLCIGSQ